MRAGNLFMYGRRMRSCSRRNGEVDWEWFSEFPLLIILSNYAKYVCFVPQLSDSSHCRALFSTRKDGLENLHFQRDPGNSNCSLSFASSTTHRVQHALLQPPGRCGEATTAQPARSFVASSSTKSVRSVGSRGKLCHVRSGRHSIVSRVEELERLRDGYVQPE